MILIYCQWSKELKHQPLVFSDFFFFSVFLSALFFSFRAFFSACSFFFFSFFSFCNLFLVSSSSSESDCSSNILSSNCILSSVKVETTIFRHLCLKLISILKISTLHIKPFSSFHDKLLSAHLSAYIGYR